MERPRVIDDGDPYMVTATLTEPIVDADRAPIMIDSLVAWSVAQRMGRGDVARDTEPEDLALPFARWQQGDLWGWCASRAAYTVTRHTAGQIRRKPATGAMARYTTVGRHHLALGPHKARDTTVEASWVDRLTWSCLVTDRDLLASLLADVTHVGRSRAIGYGRIGTWTIEPATNTDGWMNRHLPGDGPMQRVRPPYWHSLGRVACS